MSKDPLARCAALLNILQAGIPSHDVLFSHVLRKGQVALYTIQGRRDKYEIQYLFSTQKVIVKTKSATFCFSDLDKAIDALNEWLSI